MKPHEIWVVAQVADVTPHSYSWALTHVALGPSVPGQAGLVPYGPQPMWAQAPRASAKAHLSSTRAHLGWAHAHLPGQLRNAKNHTKNNEFRKPDAKNI